MNVAVRFPDTPQSRRFAIEADFDQARIEEQRARSAKDDFAKRIFRKELPANSELVLERLSAALNLAVTQKLRIMNILLNTRDDLVDEEEVTFQMERAIRDLTAPAKAVDPNDEHRLTPADVL